MLLPPLPQVVVYEANLRAEGPTGGFAALTQRLDSIRALGVNVLWLMPVQPVGKIRSAGGLGSPYATADYNAINPEFGSVADFQALVDAVHRRKMAIIIDWAANHTAWDHPWIKAHPDWYVHDAKGNVSIPPGTNWKDVAALDYRNPDLRTAMIAAMREWVVRYRIDGFRCDSSDRQPADFWRATISRLRAASTRPLLMLAEGFRKENAAVGFDLEYGWPFYDRLTAIYKGEKAMNLTRAAAQEAGDDGRHLRFITNHDKDAWEGTPLETFRTPDGVRGAIVVTTLYSGGTPLVYEGEEVAWPKRIPIFDRSSIDWSSESSQRLWLQGLMAMRRAHPALIDGTTTDLSTNDVVAFRRRSGGDEAFVLVNVRDHPASVRGLSGSWRDGFSGRLVQLSNEMELPRYGYRVFVRSGH